MRSGLEKKSVHHCKIRIKTQNWLDELIKASASINRNTALSKICAQLECTPLHPEALRLIELFQIVPEELSEAGLPYEMLKALEKQALFI
jgi:hypothetical protein